MKKFLVVLAVAVSSIVFGQQYKSEYFLGKVFYDSILYDQFLIKQRSADFMCSGFTINATSESLEIDPTTWIYKQDFSQYTDTTKFSIIYEAIAYDNGFHYEYIKVFNVSTNEFVRQLMASYEINSNRLVGLMDSDISW